MHQCAPPRLHAAPGVVVLLVNTSTTSNSGIPGWDECGERIPPRGLIKYTLLLLLLLLLLSVCVLVKETRKEGRAAQFLRFREVKEAERRTSFSKLKKKQAITVKVS